MQVHQPDSVRRRRLDGHLLDVAVRLEQRFELIDDRRERSAGRRLLASHGQSFHQSPASRRSAIPGRSEREQSEPVDQPCDRGGGRKDSSFPPGIAGNLEAGTQSRIGRSRLRRGME